MYVAIVSNESHRCQHLFFLVESDWPAEGFIQRPPASSITDIRRRSHSLNRVVFNIFNTGCTGRNPFTLLFIVSSNFSSIVASEWSNFSYMRVGHNFKCGAIILGLFSSLLHGEKRGWKYGRGVVLSSSDRVLTASVI